MRKPLSQKENLAFFGASLVRLCEEVRAMGEALQRAVNDIDVLKKKMAEIGTDSDKATSKRKKKVVL